MSTLKTEFQDRDYRRAYAESFANTVIATQLRLMRGPMTQKEFADAVGMQQSRISAMEDENYAAWSTKTLKQIAARCDVVFVGRFISFGELLKWSYDLSEGALSVAPFDKDRAFSEPSKSESTTLEVEHVLPAFMVGQTSTNLRVMTASAESTAVLQQAAQPRLALVKPARNAA